MKAIILNQTVRHSSQIDFTGDRFRRTREKNPGWYVFDTYWLGPFKSEEEAILNICSPQSLVLAGQLIDMRHPFAMEVLCRDGMNYESEKK